MRGRRWLGITGWWALALLIAGVAAWPLWPGPGLLNTRGGGDSPFLLQRLQQLETAVLDGHFPVRWMPDANYGYGYPFYNFYAPLSLYISLAFRLLGFSYVRAIQLAQTAGFLVAAAGMFRLGRRWWGSEMAGLVTSAAYTLAPFHLVNVYVRGDSLAEFWAMAFYPWVLLTATDCLYPEMGGVSRRTAVAWFALSYAALILSHNISALIFSPFLLLYLLLEIRKPSIRQAFRLAATFFWPFLLALGLAAWFFLPALAEQSGAQLGPVTAGYFHFSQHFRRWDLLQGAAVFDYNPDGGQAFRLGLVQVGTAVTGLLFSLWPRFRGKLTARYWLFICLTGLMATGMITPLSRPLWEHLPLLPFTQFPWRFLSIWALAGAMLSGGLTNLPRGALVTAVTCLLLLLAGLGGLHPDYLLLTDADVTAESLAHYEWFTGNIGTTISAEYLPPTVNPRPVTSPWLETGTRWTARPLSGHLLTETLRTFQTDQQSWQLTAGAEGATVMLPTLYWPGWGGELDGAMVQIRPSPSSGLITLDIPPGDHTVMLRLQRTPLRLTAELLSLTASGLLLWLLYTGRSPQPSPSRASFPRLALICLAGLLILGFLLHLSPERPFSPNTFTWDFDQMAYLHHDEAGVTFADGGQLQGYIYDRESVRPGETLRVTLIGQAATTATLSLTTPAIYRYPTAPALVTAVHPFTNRTTLALPIPLNAPAGLYLPQLQLETAPLMPSGQTRGDLFLRPIRVMTAAETAVGRAAPLDVRPVQITLSPDTAVLELTLAWLTQQPLSQNYNVSLRLRDSQGQDIGQFDQQPGYGFRPSSSWPVDQWVNDRLGLPLPADWAAHAPLSLMVQLYEIGGSSVLLRRLGEVGWVDGALHFQPQTAQFTWPQGVEEGAETAVFQVNDTPILKLLAYNVSKTAGQLHITLYWQALAPMHTNYTRFVHLLTDPNAPPLAQNDAYPLGNSYPTSQWTPGEIITEQLTLPAPPGDWQVVCGWYENLGDSWPRVTAVGRATPDTATPPPTPFPQNAVPLTDIPQTP